MVRRKWNKKQISEASIITLLIGFALLFYSMGFASSCQNTTFAADKSQYISGLQCTIAFSDVLILVGISIVILVIGLATLKK